MAETCQDHAHKCQTLLSSCFLMISDPKLVSCLSMPKHNAPSYSIRKFLLLLRRWSELGSCWKQPLIFRGAKSWWTWEMLSWANGHLCARKWSAVRGGSRHLMACGVVTATACERHACDPQNRDLAASSGGGSGASNKHRESGTAGGWKSLRAWAGLVCACRSGCQSADWGKLN